MKISCTVSELWSELEKLTYGQMDKRMDGVHEIIPPVFDGHTKIGGLPPLLVQVPILIVNNYSEFQVNTFSNIRKCQSFHMMPTTTPLPTTPGL